MISLRVCRACFAFYDLEFDKHQSPTNIEMFECVVESRSLVDSRNIYTTITWDSYDEPPPHCRYRLEHLMATRQC
jgi:hypothetical protein